jgi:hypothetical protein
MRVGQGLKDSAGSIARPIVHKENITLVHLSKALEEPLYMSFFVVYWNKN